MQVKKKKRFQSKYLLLHCSFSASLHLNDSLDSGSQLPCKASFLRTNEDMPEAMGIGDLEARMSTKALVNALN